MLLDISVLNPSKVVFEGKAKSVIMPGEEGVFEVLPFHKYFISRLISGTMIIDEKVLLIQRGVAMINQNKVTVLIGG